MMMMILLLAWIFVVVVVLLNQEASEADNDKINVFTTPTTGTTGYNSSWASRCSTLYAIIRYQYAVGLENNLVHP